MDQSRLNFLNSFFSYKNNFFKYYNFLRKFDFTFQGNLKQLKNYNNSYYYNRKVKKNMNINFKLKLKKTFCTKNINNILFF